MTPAIEQMDSMVSWTSFPGESGLEAEQKMIEMRDQILGGANVADTLKKTQTDINALIN